MNDDKLPHHRIPQYMVEHIPGPILLPARFVLSSDKQDLADWDEPDSLWIEDTSYWLYVFCQEQTSKQNLVKLACEIFVDGQGDMHDVNLDKLWTETKRPAPENVTAKVFLQIGYALITSVVQPYALWIWASPFQMNRSRLPPFSGPNRTCRMSEFEKWADQRDLWPITLLTEKFRGDALPIPVEPSWIHAFALNRTVRRYLEALDARLNEDALKERFLYSAVRRIPNYALHVDTKRYSDFYGEILHDELVLQQGLDEKTLELVGFLGGRTFTAMWTDMEASEDPTAWPKMQVISARSYDRLWEARAAVPHLTRVADRYGKFLESSFSMMLAAKTARKVGRAYWKLVKMFVEAAKYEGMLPKWTIKACQDFAKEWYGVTLVLGKTDTTGKALSKIFTEESVAELKAKSTGHVWKSGFMAFVEIVNAGLAIYDLYAHWDEPGGRKRAVNMAGAIASAGGALAKRQLWKSSLGSLAAATDVYLGQKKALEAKVTGDDRAALFHSATAVGGAVGVAGYVLAIFGATAPVGAVLVFLGGATGAGGGIGAAIFHDSDLDEWVKFCKWGKLATNPEAGKVHGKEIERSWSEGPLSTLSENLDRQIRTLNNLVHRLKVELKFKFTVDGQRLGIDVSSSMQFLGDQSTMWLEVTMNGHPVRPWSPWKSGAAASGVQACFHEQFPGADCRMASVRLRVDMFGDQKHWFPSKDVIVSAESTRFGPEVFAPPYVEPA